MQKLLPSKATDLALQTKICLEEEEANFVKTHPHGVPIPKGSRHAGGHATPAAGGPAAAGALVVKKPPNSKQPLWGQPFVGLQIIQTARTLVSSKQTCLLF